MCKFFLVGCAVFVARKEPHCGIQENVCSFDGPQNSRVTQRNILFRRQRSIEEGAGLDVRLQIEELQPMNERAEPAFRNEVNNPLPLARDGKRFVTEKATALE